MEKEYWDKRWADQQTGWDIGYVSTPIKEYFDQMTDKNQRILIPGCGNAYEAEYLWEQGFKNTWIVEISQLAVDSFLKRYPKFPKDHIFVTNFFALQEKFDCVVEQTFFCAIDPSMRASYAKKVSEILNPGGKLVGLLFNRHFDGGPPFGGNQAEYEATFGPYFSIEKMENAYNSIPPRKDTELFIRFTKKV